MRSIGAANPRIERCCGPESRASRCARRVRPGPARIVTRRGRSRWRCAQRCVADACRTAVLAQIDLDALDPARVRIKHLRLKRFGPRHQLAAHRNMASLGNQVTAERVDLFRNIADIELAANRSTHVIEAGAAIS